MATSEDKPASTDADIWREAADRLQMATDAESQNRMNGVEAQRFEWGEQWDTDVSNARKIEGRPALTVNHTAVQTGRVKNTLRQQRPRIDCHPVGDGADIETARIVKGLIRHIETRSDANVAYDRGGSCAVTIGWGYWRIVSEYVDERSFDQELAIKTIRNPFTVYMDPSSAHPAGLDQKWCLITEKMKRAEYKRRYPKADNCDWTMTDAPGDGSLEWESKEEIRLAEYYRVREYADELCVMSDGSIMLKSEFPSAENMAAIQLKIANGDDGKPMTRSTARIVVQWFRLNGKQVVERRDLKGTHIPVIKCEGQVEEIDGRVLRKGMVSDMMDPARIFNYTESQKAERYALTPKAPWVAAEGQLDGHPEWVDANQKSYSTLIYKPTLGPDGATLLPPPARTPPAPVEAGMAEWSQSAERNLMAVAGMTPEDPGIKNRVVSGNKYLQRRQGMQDLVHFLYYDNQTLSIAATGMLLLEQIPFYYDTKRVQRIIGEDGTPELVTINDRGPSEEDAAVERVLNDVTTGRFDVVMDTGPGYATKREENAESMTALLGTPLGEVVVKTGADVVLRNFDFPGADELADRAAITNPEAMGKIVEGLPKRAQQIVGALQQQLQQQGQVIQQLQMEIKYKGGIEQFKQGAETERAEAKNTTDIQKQAMGDATRRDVAEIGAAAQLLNSQQESRTEERMADKMIEQGAKSAAKE